MFKSLGTCQFRKLGVNFFARNINSANPQTLNPLNDRKSNRKYMGLGAAMVLGYVAYSDEKINQEIRFASHAVQRTSNVAFALSKCVYHYRQTLKKQYATTAEKELELRNCHLRCALITRRAIERNKGIFIKLGQHICALTYIFPKEWTDTMTPLQDECPVTKFDEVLTLIEQETDAPWQQSFKFINPVPIGTASLAQVHTATNLDGEQIAVKIQHPSLQKYIPLDLELTSRVFQMVDYFFPEYPLTWLSREMKNTVFQELDFRVEATNAINTSQSFAKFKRKTKLRIPKIYRVYKRLLCMEYVPGIKPTNISELKAYGINLGDLSKKFANIFSIMLFVDGVAIHCDPHSGNVAVKPKQQPQVWWSFLKFWGSTDYDIVLYDHGLYRSVPLDLKYYYAKFWLAMLNKDQMEMKRWAKKFANISDRDFEVFSAAITGRDFKSATDGSYYKKFRSNEEIIKMKSSLTTSDLPSKIIKMLKSMPSLVLLILKTNDLVRCLDDQLGHPVSASKQFAIMAKYCNDLAYNLDHSWWSYITTRIKLDILQFV